MGRILKCDRVTILMHSFVVVVVVFGWFNTFGIEYCNSPAGRSGQETNVSQNSR